MIFAIYFLTIDINTTHSTCPETTPYFSSWRVTVETVLIRADDTVLFVMAGRMECEVRNH